MALTLLFAVVALLILVFLACFSATRKAHVAGVLLPDQGLIRIQSSQSGVITAVRVREGQSVRTGDVLFVLTSERASATQGEAERIVTELLKARRDSIAAERTQQHQQARQRLAAQRLRAGDLAAESDRIEQQIALQRRRVDLASQSLKRHAELQAASFVSMAAVQDRQADLIDQQQRLADLQRVKAANAREFANAMADLRDQQFQARRDQEATSRAIATTEQDLAENEARREVFVRAPQDGSVTGISVSTGSAASAGQGLATVVPAGSSLEAELYAPSRAAGFIKAGMPVLLRYQAYPHQKFGQFHGEVREISASAMQPGELSLPSIAQGSTGTEPVYRVRVALAAQTVRAYGRDQTLRPGMTLEASVLLERRPLYEWILEPLYSIRGRV
jgi:membrane fusion protein